MPNVKRRFLEVLLCLCGQDVLGVGRHASFPTQSGDGVTTRFLLQPAEEQVRERRERVGNELQYQTVQMFVQCITVIHTCRCIYMLEFRMRGI